MPPKAKETLRGLPGVAVVIEPLHPTTERDGLTQHQLQTEVEQQLKNAGIRVLTQEEWKKTPGAPYLVCQRCCSEEELRFIRVRY